MRNVFIILAVLVVVLAVLAIYFLFQSFPEREKLAGVGEVGEEGDKYSVFINNIQGGGPPKDTRLANDAFVFGIVVNNQPKAYYVEAVKKVGEVRDEFARTKIILRHDKELDVVRMIKQLPDGGEERINPFSAFWFSWATAHPDTELYK